MRARHFLLLALAGLLAAGSAAGTDAPSAPIHLKVTFGGYNGEIEMGKGEPVRLRDHRSGEVVFLRAVPVPGKAGKARIELSRAQDERAQDERAAQRTDLLELAVGEQATVRSFASRMDIQLIDTPIEAGARSSEEEDRFQINLELPGGRSLMAIGYASPDEMVRLNDRRTGLSLGFRPALPKAGHSLDVEVFSLDAKSDDGDGARFLARVPMDGNFTLRGDRLGLPGDSAAQIKIRGHVQPPDPAMWDGLAHAGSPDGAPVALQARWAGSPWIQGKAYGGLMFRLTVPGAPDEIGMAPASTCSTGSRSVSVFQIHKIPGAGETLKLIDTVQVREDQPIRVLGFEGQLEIQGVSKPAPQLKGMCWLGCGNSTTAHGCGVSCGDVDCCVGMCCRV